MLEQFQLSFTWNKKCKVGLPILYQFSGIVLTKARYYHDFKVTDGRYFPSSSEVLCGGAAIKYSNIGVRSENGKYYNFLEKRKTITNVFSIFTWKIHIWNYLEFFFSFSGQQYRRPIRKWKKMYNLFRKWFSIVFLVNISNQ